MAETQMFTAQSLEMLELKVNDFIDGAAAEVSSVQHFPNNDSFTSQFVAVVTVYERAGKSQE